MPSLTHPCLDIQTDESPHPSIPSWFAEIVLIATALRNQGQLSAQSRAGAADAGTIRSV